MPLQASEPLGEEPPFVAPAAELDVPAGPLLPPDPATLLQRRSTERKSFAGRLRVVARRKRLVAGTLVAGLVAASLSLGALRNGDSESPETAPNFSTVRRTRIVAVRSLDGEIVARGEGPPVLTRLTGTLTDVAAEGAKIERGESLFGIDGQPVILFYGALPAWRDIGGPDPEPGADIEQLEQNLETLGFSTGGADDVFTSTTESAVDAWLSSIGLPQTGVARLGRVYFARAALTVARHLKPVGAPVADGDEILATVSSEKVVRTTLGSSGELAPGDVVSVAAGGKKLRAKVVAVDGGGGAEDDAAAVATVVPDEAGALSEMEDGATVSIEIPGEARENALVVPVTALIARRGGGYAVEVDLGGGRTELVAVTPGLYALNEVEVEGALEEGDRVVVP